MTEFYPFIFGFFVGIFSLLLIIEILDIHVEKINQSKRKKFK